MKAMYKENYNSKQIVELWKDFIDWEKRRKGGQDFLKKSLEKNKCQKIFESCLGDGCDSIFLTKKGFDVVSNDIDLAFIKKAQQNAREANVKLDITSFDWRKLNGHFEKETFDAVLCLGNSLTYLFSKKDQLKTLKQFNKILRTNGVLLIDERNYVYFLSEVKKILDGEFKYSKKFVYCGAKVDARPIFISKNKVIMQYKHLEKKICGKLIVYPFKEGELLKLLKSAGFKKVEQFSDFKSGKNKKADFFTYIAYK